MRLLARLLVAVGASIVGVATVGVVPAVAAPTWSVQASPNPVVPTGALLSVSCTSAACIGVGYTSNSAGTDLTLAEVWNGSSWTVQATPNPSGAIYSFLSGVSCSSATSCTAVGYYGNSSGTELTLAEAWNGSTWSIQSTPTPSGATFSAFSGVSCASASACVAVGSYGTKNGSQLPLAEAWNGSSWSVQTVPTPSGASNTSLSGVSCTSGTACTAVGSYFNKSAAQLTLAESLSGTTWSVQSTPNPSGATLSALSGVSCTSATACTGVGNYFNSAGNQLTLAERWNGTTWSIQTTPNPAGTTLSSLSGVSCISGTSCTAVGSYVNTAGTQLTLAEAWNGTAWSIQSTPNVGGASVTAPLGVSCVASTGGCFAAGFSTNAGGTRAAFAVGYYGVFGWLVISAPPSPSGAASSTLAGVSCPSATACSAVGSSVNNTGAQVPAAEGWNGTSWAVQTTPVPSGATASSLSGVSCTSPSSCEAVGSAVNSSGTTVTLAESWNGTAWTVQSTPNPSGATASSLSGVSCISATACTAVGNTIVNGSRVTLAEAWNGTSWAVQPTRNPAGQYSALVSVSCVASTGGCLAVGYYGNSAGTRVTLAEGYYGPIYGWLVLSTPNPTGATLSSLAGVSCPTSTSCTVVGFANTPNRSSLAESWNGSAFTIQPTPAPSGATQTSLAGGVSCTSPTACTGVGYYLNSSAIQVTLAEAWNGTSWAVQSTPNPSIATASVLNGVSCTAASSCNAVGSYANGIPLTLAEAER